MSHLHFDCNYDCGKKVFVDLEGWDKMPKDEGGQFIMPKAHQWLGERVFASLIAHHANDCLEFNRQPDGRPGLQLIVGGIK